MVFMVPLHRKSCKTLRSASWFVDMRPKLVEFARVDRAMEVCRDALWEPYLVNQRLRIVKLMNAWLRTRHWIPLPQQYIAAFR